ncbi:glycoside hydrolase family 10 protein [Bradyrhizobium sp. WBAH33]|uniref:glycoside hydrolase family 10 protein n=1 Tax=Bradyrhizobium sp. WBAH33 TaxID=1420727 RepID=UPI003A0FC808
MRGIWLATVSRLDWPPVSSVNISNPTSRARVQQQAMINKLNHLQRLGINTVFFQVKPDGTALWPSKILPWSDLMTGKIGENPGYDPLQFMLDEAHKRGMKVHAWFNPYRVSVNTKPGTIRERSTRGRGGIPRSWDASSPTCSPRRARRSRSTAPDAAPAPNAHSRR